MSKLELHRKYRPKFFDDIVGNEVMLSTLQSTLVDERPHTILLRGPSGCGKTTLARIVAAELGATGKGLKEYNISMMRGIDTARQIIRLSGFSPLEGESSVFVLNECHMGTTEFWNAMLEILEEPPPHVYFILCTTDPDKLLEPVRSRCSKFTVSTLQRSKIVNLLKRVYKEEVNSEEYPIEVFKEIASVCNGSPREALVILGQVIDIQDDDEMLKGVVDATISSSSVIELCRALLANKGWDTVSEIVKGLDSDPEAVRRAVLGYFNSVVLGKKTLGVEVGILEQFLEPFYNSGKAGLTVACAQAVLFYQDAAGQDDIPF